MRTDGTHYKTLIRGPMGKRGEDGLSAYGLWLKEGNTGTVSDFFASICPQREMLHAVHSGGQTVKPGGRVAFEKTFPKGINAGKGIWLGKAGSYLAFYMLCGKGSYGIIEESRNGFLHTVFEAGRGMQMGLIEIKKAPARLCVVNLGNKARELKGARGAADASLFIVRLNQYDL